MDSVIIERDNITLDGKGHVLQGTGMGNGVNLTSRYNVTIQNMQIENFSYGIYLYASSNIILFNDTIKNSVSDGIYAVYTDNSIVWGNNIKTNKRYGIDFAECGNNKIFHNNLTNNTIQVHLFQSFNNIWDDGYPSGGNYWSNYTGIDIQTGQFQNITGSDGLGDTAHTLDMYNQDKYPLIAPINQYDAGEWNSKRHVVDVVSDSLISDFQLNRTQKTLNFNVTCENELGFARITLPTILVQDMWQGNYTVLVDGTQVSGIRNWTYEDYTYAFFTFTYAEHEVIVIPELSYTTIVFSFAAVSIMVIIAIKKKKIPQNHHISRHNSSLLNIKKRGYD
jgi:parallel beta-helix repeat protein